MKTMPIEQISNRSHTKIRANIGLILKLEKIFVQLHCRYGNAISENI